MGRKTSRGVIKYAVFKEFNKIMKMLLHHTSKRKIKKTRSFYELCSVVLSFLLNLVLCLLAEDFIGMFIHFSDSKVYILAIIVSVLLTVYGFEFISSRPIIIKSSVSMISSTSNLNLFDL